MFILKGYLDIEYFNETGTGNGPTLEFYSLFSKEMREQAMTWLRTSDYSLFPLPAEKGIAREETKKLFTMIGYMIARGLYDDRLLDMPLNPLFWDIVLERVFDHFILAYFAWETKQYGQASGQRTNRAFTAISKERSSTERK